MTNNGIDAEVFAQQLGIHGVDNLVTNAERVCTCEQQRMQLTNEASIRGLEAEFSLLLAEERRIEERLQFAPPAGDVRRLRRRAVFYWSLTVLLTVSGFCSTLLSLAPFRLGWPGWMYSAGIAALTPFLVDHMLEGRNMEKIVRILTAIAMVTGLAGLMLLADIRGDLFAQELHQAAAQSVVIDDAAPQPEPVNTFYDSATMPLRAALLLIAFTMELGAGLVLRAAWRSAPDSSEDWDKLRGQLVTIRKGMAEIVRQVTMLRNEPEVFANRFWRDFYRAMLSNAARNAMTRLMILAAGILLCGAATARAEHFDMVIAIDLSKSVATVGPDGKSDFQKNVVGVARVLAQVPADCRVTVIGITDHSFTQPYILLSARIPGDTGYFGERLNSGRNQLVRAWKERSVRLEPHFQQTDIFGALRLTAQVFAQQPEADRKTLVVFSDMRQTTPELDLESQKILSPFSAVAKRRGVSPVLRKVDAFVLGVDGAGKSVTYWQSLQTFWQSYLQNAGATLQSYSMLREIPSPNGIRWSKPEHVTTFRINAFSNTFPSIFSNKLWKSCQINSRKNLRESLDFDRSGK